MNLKNNKQLSMFDSKTGFEYLEFMCKNVKNKTSSLRAEVEPMTDRVTFIVDCLNKLGLNYQLIPFSAEETNDIGYNKAKLVNVQVFFKSSVQYCFVPSFEDLYTISKPSSTPYESTRCFIK